MGAVSNVDSDTVSKRLVVGGICMISEREMQFVPRFVKAERPIGGRRKILDEESFVQIAIVEGLTDAKAVKKYRRHGLTRNAWLSSKTNYKEKYAEELKKAKHRHYSVAKKGNQHGMREMPATVLSEVVLKRMAESGKKLSVIATELGTTEWFVKKNLELFGLSKTGELPYRMQHVDLEYLERLEVFCPGILERARAFYEEPHEFFLALYGAYTKLNELLWFVKQQSKGHRRYRESGRVPKDHICWNANQYEIRLSMGLLEKGLSHVRQYCFLKRYMADFAFPEKKLLVEIDGARHWEGGSRVESDLKRQEAAERMGYKMLRFTTTEVLISLPQVISQIESALLSR